MWGRAVLLVLVTAALMTSTTQAVQDEDSQLKVGRSIDIFTRYGYLSLSMKVSKQEKSTSVQGVTKR